MKKVNILYIVPTLILSFSSCEKFLDVNPKTEMKQELLFSDEQGFKDALTGVYINMAGSSGYGEGLSQSTIENLVSSWDVTSGSVQQRLGLFNFADETVSARFDAIMQNQYKSVALINAILDNIDTKKAVFKDENLYNLIKSECLGLRAFIHLDLMRLYGPIPSDPTKGNQLAYVTNFSKEINNRVSFDQYKEMLFKDISDAFKLSEISDPFIDVTMEQMRTPTVANGFAPVESFFAYRYLKMNYYAIKGLEARAHLWYGNKSEALAASKVIIEAKKQNGDLKFPLATSADYTAKDYVLSREHLFGLYDHRMYDKYALNYSSGLLKKGTAESTIKTTLYGNTGSDMRESSLWNLITLSNASKANIPRKYEVADPKTVTASTDFKQIPLLRTSEMYLIAAECAPFAEGLQYFGKFYEARNKKSIALPTTEGSLLTELIKEYRREFYAEGQAFYCYKRNNSARPAIIFAPSAAVVNYLLPLPKVETVNQ